MRTANVSPIDTESPIIVVARGRGNVATERMIDATGVPGHSLRALMEGWADEEAAGGGDPVVLSVMPNESDPTMLGPSQRGPMVAIVNGNLHYIRNGDGVEELYDFVADRLEEHDLSRTAAMDSVLAEFRRSVDSLPGWPPGG